MKPLRELAGGYSLLIGGPGEGASPWGIWKYADAPAECFADAKPEEPLREGNRVVVKDGGSHLRAIRGNDADFAGQHGTIAAVPPGISTIVYVLLDGGTRHIFWRGSLRRERDDERPAATTSSHTCNRAKKPDPEGWKREFYPTDASECPKEEAVRYALQIWRGRRKEALENYGLEKTPIHCQGNNCPLCTHYRDGNWDCSDQCPLIVVSGKDCTASGSPWLAWYKNKDPEPMIAALEKCLEQEQAKKKQEPPPRKYEDGQWLRSPGGSVGIVTQADPTESLPRSWIYRLRLPDNSTIWYAECDLTPCPPPLSEAQRRLLPGDKVRVIDIPVGPDGAPVNGVKWLGMTQPLTIYSIVSDDCGILAKALVGGVIYRYHLWNLDPAEGE